MSNYTVDELKSMTRVQLRKAAIAELGIDNLEASNYKSDVLIDKIMANGNGEEPAPPKKAKGKSTKRGAKKSDGNGAAKAAATEAPANGVGKLVDAVGKAVDETKEELSARLKDILENQEHMMKQQFILFGLICDIYKVDYEPDVLEKRIEALDVEWDSQGN